jgi:hypothetical protein
MKPRILVTVGGRTALPVLAGLIRLPVDVWAAAPEGLTHHVQSLPGDRVIPLGSLGGRAYGEEVLEVTRDLRADAVIPTGDADLRATADLGWVFDLRGVALAAPAIWTLSACEDPSALARAWPERDVGAGSEGGPGTRPGSETWWDVVVDRDGGLRWVRARGAAAGPDALARVGEATRALGLRYAASLLTRVQDDGRMALVKVRPRFTASLGPVVARGVNVPRIVLELLLRRELPRATTGAPSTWAPSTGSFLHA